MVNGTGHRLLWVTVMQIRDMQRLAGVTDVVGEHAGSTEEAWAIALLRVAHHGIEDLPDAERQQAAMLRADGIAGEHVGHLVVERVPAIGIDSGWVLARSEEHTSELQS